MSSLLEKQKRKGGVIDVEQERNKFLIDITSVCICKMYTELLYFVELSVITCLITSFTVLKPFLVPQKTAVNILMHYENLSLLSTRVFDSVQQEIAQKSVLSSRAFH